MADIIGVLDIPFELVDGKLVFNIPEDASDADLRADFTLANREVDQIKEKPELSKKLIDRLTVLQGYKKAIRDIVFARKSAKDLLAEDVTLDEPAPVVEPAAATTPPSPAAEVEPAAPAAPAPAAAADDENPAEEVDFVIEADGTVVDKQGNRYTRIASADDKARQIDADSLAAISASLTPAKAKVSPLLATEPTDEQVNKKMAERAPLMAALGGFNQGQDRAGERIEASQAAHLLHRSAHQQTNSPSTQYLFRQDRLAPLQASLGIERIAGGVPINQAALDLQTQHVDAILAAFCGPGELTRDIAVNVNTNRPVAAAQAAATPPVAIGLGTHEFFRAMSLADIYAHYAANPSAPEGIGMWNATDQALVDPDDPTTWKGYFTLPACPCTVQVSAYFLWRALRVTVEDQMSRPQYIDNITTLMEAILARTAESAMLDTYDAWSFQRTVPNTPGYGALAQLMWGIENVMAWATSTARIDRTGYSLIVPEALVNAARLDAYFAGENPADVMNRVNDAGGGNVVVTQDWGLEGNPMVPMPVQPTPDDAAADNGTAIPLIPTVFTIRLVPLEDFVWGSTGVVDYGINTSPDLRRQNAALFFGEQAEIMYKNGGRPSFSLTLEDVVSNGARADRVAPFTRSDQAADDSIPSLVKATLAADQFVSNCAEPAS
jgi:hypothetical protein